MSVIITPKRTYYIVRGVIINNKQEALDYLAELQS